MKANDDTSKSALLSEIGEASDNARETEIETLICPKKAGHHELESVLNDESYEIFGKIACQLQAEDRGSLSSAVAELNRMRR